MSPPASDQENSASERLESGLQSIVQALNLGAYETAMALSSRILDDYPDELRLLQLAAFANCHAGHLETAIILQKRLLEINSEDEESHKNLVDFMLLAGIPDETIEACRTALKFCGDDCDMADWFMKTWATIEWQRGNSEGCVEPLELQIKLNPANVTAHRNLSCALTQLGRSDEALEVYTSHCVTPWDGKLIDQGDAVERVYDSMAGEYDRSSLHLSFGRRMGEFIREIVDTTRKYSVLDAGCGTGQAGQNLKELAQRLTGFDLSPGMVDKAAELGIYDSLFKGRLDEMSEIISRSEQFELIVSSCALYHIPDLGSFFNQSATLLRCGGYLFISVDPAPDSVDVGVTKTSPNQEFAHSRKYLRRLCAENGLAEVEIRVMPHRPTPGYWCAFQKT